MDPFDPDRLRTSESVQKWKDADKRKLPQHRMGEAFLKGPIPWAWMCCAAKLPGKSCHVGILLWYEGGRRGKATIRLTQRLLAQFDVGRAAARRDLNYLEKAGLVEVDHKRGRCPVVTILEPPGEQSINGTANSQPRN